MIYNLIIHDRSLAMPDPFVMSFYTHYNIPLPAEKAARRAVAKYLRTTEGRKDVAYNVGSFNWGDVASSVPDSFFEAEGLFPINGSENIASVVCHDEDLTISEGEYFVSVSKELKLNADTLSEILEKVLAGELHKGTFTLITGDFVGQADLIYVNPSDRIYNAMSNPKDCLTIACTETNATYTLTVDSLLSALRLWYQSGRAPVGFADEKGNVDTSKVTFDDADVILQFAVWGDIKYDPTN